MIAVCMSEPDDVIKSNIAFLCPLWYRTRRCPTLWQWLFAVYAPFLRSQTLSRTVIAWPCARAVIDWFLTFSVPSAAKAISAWSTSNQVTRSPINRLFTPRYVAGEDWGGGGAGVGVKLSDLGKLKLQTRCRVRWRRMSSFGVIPKGLLTFFGFFFFFYAMRSLVPDIRTLIHLACLRVFSVTPWVIVYRLYRVRWQGQSDWF